MNVLRCLVILVILHQTVPSPLEAQPLREHPDVAPTIKLLEQWIEAQMEYRALPGLALAIVHDQTLVWSRGFGYADLKTRTPMTPRTIFRIASITKTFTSTAILQLRDRGKLRLDDPVSTYLPWFTYKNRHAEGPAVTVRQLLTHTSGLPRESAFPYWTDYKFPSREEMVTALQSQESIFEPETRYKYSNLGMAILGEVVATAAGESYDAYITKNILQPLRMTSSSVSPPESLRSRYATGYGRRFADGTRMESPFMDSRGLTPAANISSTVEDLALFASFHMLEGKNTQGQILKGSTLREMHRVHWIQTGWRSGRGLGFAVSKDDSRVTYGHGGWVAGNRSQLLISPKEKVAVIVMTNADDGAPGFFANRALSMLAPVIAKATAPPVSEPKPDPLWQKYVGTYTDPSGWETEVMIMNNKLVLYGYGYPPEDDPTNSITELTPEGTHRFRMTGESDSGELVEFELGADGKVVRVKSEENYMYPKR
ncbi:MAG: putative beta-lactamase class penicillin binding protein [Bacteroidetes bacterium]|nr:putative beta-lactamase class penicillin binding protein [Bacteroidota bacterium]